MTERTALILLFVAIPIVMAAVYLTLTAFHAGANALALAYVLILVGAADTASRIVIRYHSD
jgi:hypothetical protein